MAHELEIVNGEVKMFYAGEKPWHGLGTSVETELTSDKAIIAAGLNWKVVKQPLFISDLRDSEHFKYDPVSKWFATVREPDSKVLGVVRSNYQIIQNEDAFKFLDALVGEGLAMYHTAGSLFDGSRIFICCKLPNDLQVGPDKIEKYLVACTGHDGTLALHVKWTPIRVVCNNTLTAAFGNIHGGFIKDDGIVRIKHTGNWQQATEEARRILGLTNLYYERLDQCFQQLINSPITDEQVNDLTTTIIPIAEKSEVGERHRKEKRQRILYIYHNCPDLKVVQGTKWAAYNAVAQWTDHEQNYKKGDIASKRMNSIVYGTGASLKMAALTSLLAV